MNNEVKVGAVYRVLTQDGNSFRVIGVILKSDATYIEGDEMWVPLGKYTLGETTFKCRATRQIANIAIMRDIVEVPSPEPHVLTSETVEHVEEAARG